LAVLVLQRGLAAIEHIQRGAVLQINDLLRFLTGIEFASTGKRRDGTQGDEDHGFLQHFHFSK
jgi:hypothetical protein